ncbi:hypothetical protein GGR51DRAFT_542206 [Nemania sp. FL0031]|nr:hypothetical protein GGR51DRAFT_542206 [Nemania sp. FL0031]
MGRCFSRRYKDFLLLCSANRDYLNSAWGKKLLAQGANPNAVFYWGLQDKLKTSPWLEYLVDNFRYGEYDDNKTKPDMDTIKSFLDRGANLDDRIVIPKSITELYTRSIAFRVLSSPGEEWPSGQFFIAEVNAKYVRRILLVHPGYEVAFQPPPWLSGGPMPQGSLIDGQNPNSPMHFRVRPFAKVCFDDSEELLDSLRVFPSGFTRIESQPRVQEIWEKSEKIQGIEEYLEQKGYYHRKAENPICMFEEN